MEYKPNKSQGHELSNISLAAFKVLIGGLFALILGLGCQVVTAYLFGAGVEMDAFFTASIVPLYFQMVLLSGLPFVVIPAFIHEESIGNDDDAWALAGTVFWIIGIVLFVIAILGSLFASGIITIIAPGFNVAKSGLTSRMLSIMMFTIPFFGIGYLTSGVQNIRDQWFWPAAATAVGSAVNLLVLVSLHHVIGPLALAWGSLLAIIVQASITTIPFLTHGWTKRIPIQDPRVIELGKLIAPFIFFGFITFSKSLFERYFASGLPDGQLSYIGYAGKTSNIFVVLLASSIATAIFPTMARAYSQDGMDGLINRTDYALKITMAIALPAVSITSILAIPLVSVLYERGAFLHSTTLKVGILIPIVMVNDVLFRMVNNIFSRTFYILKETLIVNLIQSLTMILYIVAAINLTDKWGYFGLALAQLAQAGPSLIMLGFLLFRRISHFPVFTLIKASLFYCIASILAAFASWGTVHILAVLPTILQLIASLVVAGTIYIFLLNFIDHNIAVEVLGMTGLIKIQTFIKLGFFRANHKQSKVYRLFR